MALIDPKHYSTKADFSFWWHGPKDTNLYLWGEKGQLVKVHMEMADAAMVFEDDMILFENKHTMKGASILNNQQIGLKVLAIIQQIEDDNDLLKKFLEMVRDHVKN